MTPPVTAVKAGGGSGAGFLPRLGIRHILAAVGLIAAVAVAAAPINRLLDEAPSIETLVVENPTRYDILIDVSGADRPRWLTVGTVRREATSTFENVSDQGDVWIFRFHAQAEEGGEVRVERSELADAGWRLRIPDGVSEELQDKGAPFPP